MRLRRRAEGEEDPGPLATRARPRIVGPSAARAARRRSSAPGCAAACRQLAAAPIGLSRTAATASGAGCAGGQLGDVEDLRDHRPEPLGGGVVRLQQLLDRRTDDRAERARSGRHLDQPDERLRDLLAARRVRRADDRLERAEHAPGVVPLLAVVGDAPRVGRRDEGGRRWACGRCRARPGRTRCRRAAARTGTRRRRLPARTCSRSRRPSPERSPARRPSSRG